MDLFYKLRIISLICLFSLAQSGCLSSSHLAPIEEGSYLKITPIGYYQVKPGDTLYSIAWNFGKDYRDLAQTNRLAYPYHIQPGQLIYLKQSQPLKIAKSKSFQRVEIPKQVKLKTSTLKIKHALYDGAIEKWIWPSYGKVIQFYNPGQGDKGINIAGQSGSPVLATAAGEVVYAGQGLSAYGNLIIVKHSSIYLSAYAHNKTNLVKEGDTVKAGQKIALMGHTGTNQVMLHFEIRKAGKPIDPLRFLPKR